MKYLSCLRNIEMLKQIEFIFKDRKKKIVFLCLGNKKVNFDCYASFVADNLRKSNISAYVYGGEKYPLYGESLYEMKKFLEKNHKNDIIIFVDVVKTKNLCENGKLVISSKKYRVANSDVIFDYNYSICYLVKIDDKIKHSDLQQAAADKITTFILNCCQIF